MNFNPFTRGALAASLADETNAGFSTRKLGSLILSALSIYVDPRHSRSIIPVTLTLDTSAYTAGDTLAATQEITSVFRDEGGTAVLEGVQLIDNDDNTAADINLYFFSSNVTLGTENAAPSLSDANAALALLGIVNVPSANFIDIGGAKVAAVRNIGLFLKGATTSKSLFIGATCAGTPTQTAAGITATLRIRH